MPITHPYDPCFNDEPCLIKALQAMNTDAWSYVFEKYQQTLHQEICRSLRKRGLSDDNAPDIAQETWITAVHEIGDFVYLGEGKLYHWLRAISVRHVMSLNKRLKRDANRVSEDEVDNEFQMSHMVNEKMTPEGEILLREQFRAIQAALKELSPRDAEMIIRALFWDQKPQDLAMIYGIEVGSVYKALSRARSSIRAYLLAHRFFQPRSLTNLRQQKKNEEADE